MDLSEINQRISEVEASYQRQISKTGKFYDHSLTESLKKDLDWLREQRKSMLLGPDGNLKDRD